MREIQIADSKMQVRFRVKSMDNKTLLFSSVDYLSAEDFVWNYEGAITELKIEKVWIKKNDEKR